jgi:hypothetical protein
MHLTRKQALKTMVGTGVAITVLRPDTALASGGSRERVIERDVCVIGGGSSGTYTAVRLRDLGRSVVVVERANRLGGHCETFHDPATGRTTDIGVTVFHDAPIVRDYFGRFGVELMASPGFGSGTVTYADFRTGRVVDGYTPPVPTALATYLGLLQKYPYLQTGYVLPHPVPQELLIPWGEFIAKYQLHSLAQLVFSFGQGFNDILRLPSLYVLKYFGIDVVGNILNNSFLTTTRRDNSELYEQAAAHLGDDVLLDTTVTAVDRDRSDGVLLRVETPDGTRVIRAGKLVITLPPLPDKLASFDLDSKERTLFSRFRHGNYYTGLLRLPGVPGDLTVQNIGADTDHNLPPLPGIYAISPSSVPGLHDVKYGSTVPLSSAQVRADILTGINRLQAAGTLPPTRPAFKTLAAHAPYELTVGKADISNGFYRDLTALQGRRHTFWNGAAFQAHDSALLWRFTETLLPRLAG